MKKQMLTRPCISRCDCCWDGQTPEAVRDRTEACSKNYKLKLENLDKLEDYNGETNIDKINEKIDSITKLIPAYIILFFMSIYILSKCLKSNFTTISFIIILIYAFLIFIYIIKKHLE